MNPTTPTTPPAPAAPVQPEIIAPPVDAGGSSPGGSKKIMVVVGVLIALIVVAGGLIYLRNQKQVSVTAPTPQTVNAFEDLQKDAENADVGSDSDMSEVDKDLNSL